MEQIENASNYTLISGTSNEDSIKNTGYEGVTISTSSGNDTIYSRGKVSINAGEGNNVINITGKRDGAADNNSNFSTIVTGDGNNYISLGNGEGAEVRTGSGDDRVYHGQGYIDVGNGNNHVSVYGGTESGAFRNGSTIISGDGNDTLYSRDHYNLINAGEGDNSISTGKQATITGGSGGDSILVDGNSSINAGDGDNYVTVYRTGNSNYISTGNGNDSMSLAGTAENTVQSGAGNDSIMNGQGYFDVGDGDDYVEVFGGNAKSTLGSSTVMGGTGNDTIKVSRGVNIVYAGEGDNYISLSSDSSAYAGDGNDTFEGGNSDVVDLGDGDNYVKLTTAAGNSGNVTLTTGNGNDFYNIDQRSGNLITSGGGNDTFINVGGSNTINVGEGDNYVEINYIRSTIIGGNGNNTVKTSADRDVIKLGDGSNYVEGISNESISTGSGDDVILVKGASLIEAGNGNNLVQLSIPGGSSWTYNSNTIVTGNGDDTISLNGTENNAIRTGIGNDLVVNCGNKSTIYAPTGYYTVESGEDIIINHNYGGAVTLQGGLGKNYTFREYDPGSAPITMPSGEDTTPSWEDTTPSGEDTTPSWEDTTPSGEDTTPSWEDTTPSGEDTTPSWEDTTPFDTTPSGETGLQIYNDSSYTLITGTAYNDSIFNAYVDNVTIDAGGGRDTINNRGFYALINAGGDDDFISTADASNVTINTNSGNNTILSSENERGLINAEEGNDYIELTDSSYATINTGAGNDSIYNYGDIIVDENDNVSESSGYNVYINSGDGNDVILNTLSNATIIPGPGDDIVSLKGDDDFAVANSNEINYSIFDGNDTIYGYNWTNLIKINGSEYNIIESGNDVLITIGEGSILLKDASPYSLNILGNDGGLDTTPSEGIDTVISDDTIDNFVFNGTDKNEYIRNPMSNITINAGKGNDFIINEAEEMYDEDDNFIGMKTFINVLLNGDEDDDSIYNTFGEGATINGGEGNDLINNSGSSNVIINGGAGNDSIYNQLAEINFSNDDEESTILGFNVSINAGEGDDLISIEGSDNVIQYSNGDGNDTIYGYNSTDIIKITNGSYNTSTIGQDVIIQVGSGSIRLVNAKNTAISIDGEAEKTDTLIIDNNSQSTVKVDSTIKTIDASTRTNTTNITGNDLDNTIQGGTESDTIYGGGGNDFILGSTGDDKLYGDKGVDTLNGDAGNDTLTGGAGNDLFVYANGQGNDVITDYATGDKISISGAKISKTSISGSDVILTVGSNKLTVKDGKDKKLSIYNNSSSEISTVIADTPSDLITITNSTKSPVTVGSAIKTIDASKRTSAVKITGNSLANSIVGGKGKDTLIGGKGNDTLTGGSGADVFVYSKGDGNDVITDYTSSDQIKVDSSYSTLNSGNDVVIKVGTGKLTLKNAKGKGLNIIKNGSSSSGTSTSTSTTLKVTNSTKSPVTVGSAIKTIDASKRTTAIKITGNSSANTIKGGSKADTIYGGSGNDSILGNAGNDKLYGDAGNDKLLGGAGADTLTGGKGNDILTGGAGKDIFTYTTGDGNDTITDYAAGDVIKIKGSYSTTSRNGNVNIKVGSGSITVLNTTVKKLKITSSKNYEERWFLDNEECKMQNAELDSIINNDSNLISNDYNYDINSNLTKQLNPTLVINSNKPNKHLT